MKDVLITISSMQNLDGQDSSGPELITQGSYDYSTDGVRFSYMESELTGMTGTKTMFQIRPDEVILSRSGVVNARMVFRPGEHSNFFYRTEFGTLSVGLDTKHLESHLGEHGGDLQIEFALNFEKMFISRNQFQINIRERDLKS